MKKSLLLLVAVLVSLTSWGVTVYTTTTYENVTKNSTVYVGEVVVDGTSVIKYIYSGDVTWTQSVQQNLLAALNGMADGDYADLFETSTFCNVAELAADMDENWSSAQYVGTLYYPEKSVTSTVNSNLYDLDEGFKAAIDEQIANRLSTINNPANVEKCIVSYLDVSETDNVYWLLEGGEYVKHVDTDVVYSCEVTTVIFTKVELSSMVTGVEDINAAQPHSGQRYNLMGQPVGKDYKGLVIEDGKKVIVR